MTLANVDKLAAAKKNYVVLEPSIMKYINKVPRLPSWIVVS
jgi:hypothetical protein